MGRNLELGHLTEEECERVLQVVQRDFDLRQKEKGRLNKIEEEIKEEDSKVAILAKQKNFNDNCCMRCFSKFIFIFNQKVQCVQCQYYVCKSCSVYLSKEKQYVCHVCRKQRELGAKSCEWFYSNIKEKFKRFGSAKVVRSLYKRKTDSDSENDSGYDPSQYSNSLPVGKRTRKTIEGFFADLNNPQLAQEILSESTKESEAESRTQFPTELGTQEEQLTHFHTQLNHIVDDIHRTLDNNPTSPADLNNDPDDPYGGLLGTQRRQLCTALSDLSSGLNTISQDPQNETNTDANQTVLDEVQRYVGKPLSLEDDNSQQTGTNQWDPLAAAITHKVVSARWEADEQRHRREEEKVRRDLTKLSNQCTITQLTEYLGDSDDMHNSTFADTDTESHLSSEQPDSEPPVTSTPRSDLPELKKRDSELDLDDLVALNTGIALQSRARPRSVQQMSTSSVESSDMVITVTSPEGETFTAQSPNQEKQELAYLAASKNDSQSLAISRHFTERIDSGSESDVTIGADSDSKEDMTPHHSPVREAIIYKQQISREYVMPMFDGEEVDDGELEIEYDVESVLSERIGGRIPLPGFDDTSSLGIDEVDLDDISRHGDDDDDDEDNNNTIESEFLFCETWDDDVKQPGPGPLFKDRISAYDNFGERKVGKDGGPVMMFVPFSQVSAPTVGEKDLDELSDLSENEEGTRTLSELLSDFDIDEEDEDEGQSPTKVTADFAGQTDDLFEQESEACAAQEYMMFSPALTTDHSKLNSTATSTTKSTTMTAVRPLTEEELAQLRKKRLEESYTQEDDQEDDPEDADPRFVLRPTTVTVPAGEPARFTCQVTGTKPLDVFWYKEGEDITALEEDTNTEVRSRDDRHTLEVFNTTEASRGRYVCIAINEKGRNHKTFCLGLTDSQTEHVAPEFLKSISDLEVLEGNGVNFRCKVKGRPQPHVTWYKDGQRIVNSDQYRLQKIGNRDYQLSIEYVTMDDDAEYTVIARNVAGEARATAQLLVEAKTEATSRKYADLEEKSEAQIVRPKYPDTAELLRIAEQVHSTRTKGSSPSVTPVRSSTKLSSIHSHIDEMDRKLHSLEDEVHQSLIHRSDSGLSDDSTTNNSLFDLSDMPVTNSLRESILRENDETQAMAKSMRLVTSSALEVLTTSDTLMKASKDLESHSSQEETPQTPVGETLVISKVKEEEEEELEEELQLSYADFELLYKNRAISKEQLKSGRVRRQDGQKILNKLDELKKAAMEEELEKSASADDSTDSMLTSIDCGLKRIPSKRYKRDYIVNRSPQPQRKKSNVNTKTGIHEHQEELNRTEESDITLVDIDFEETAIDPETSTAQDQADLIDPPAEVYVATAKVVSLEERVHQLQQDVENDNEDLSDEDLSAYEDEVTRAAAQVTQSERQVSKIEKQVSNLQQRARVGSTSSQSESPTHHLLSSQSESMTHHSPTEKKPADFLSGEPVDEDINLPSVKNLRSLFNVDDGPGVKRKHAENTVYSLTGRDLPKVVRDKLKEQSPVVVSSSNVRGTEDSRKRQTLSQVFVNTSIDSDTDTSDSTSRPSETLAGTNTGPQSSTPRGTPHHLKPLDHSRVSMATPEPLHLATSPTSTTSHSSFTSTNSPTSPSSPAPSSPGGRSSTIMARAAFWDNRILAGQVSDREVKEAEFPVLPEENFKSDDEESLEDDNEESLEDDNEESLEEVPPATSTKYEARCSWDI